MTVQCIMIVVYTHVQAWADGYGEAFCRPQNWDKPVGRFIFLDFPLDRDIPCVWDAAYRVK